jgi:4-amino-4-deoxy-L-arabinose transferase-like glycosyltransferase
MTVSSEIQERVPPVMTRRPQLSLGQAVLSWRAVLVLLLMFAATANLTTWPLTWYDEGSHAMVPKSLVLFGVYADYDSSGFRYYGPTTGVGPTVLVPIAAVFKLFGIGLLQARMVMAAYLVLAVIAFHLLARRIMGEIAAWVAAVMFVLTPGAGTLEYGRQVLGEIPGFFFLCLGLSVMVSQVRRACGRRLLLSGVLLGLAAVTKYQLLVIIMPGLVLAWLLSTWRSPVRWRVFLIPAVTVGLVFGLWQVCFLGYLGPSSFWDNIRFVRRAAAGAALAFSPQRAADALRTILGPGMVFSALVPAVAYGTLRALRSDERSDAWRVIMSFTLVALGWFVFASVGWRRYAYPGVSLACLPAAAFLVEGLASQRATTSAWLDAPLRWTAVAWVTVMAGLGAATLLPRVAFPRTQDAIAMADAVNAQVPEKATIASWEPEMTFLTRHVYQVPPQELLTVAVAHVYAGGPPPSAQYDFAASGAPEFVLEGPFARGVSIYASRLSTDYRLLLTHGPYKLYRRATDISR